MNAEIKYQQKGINHPLLNVSHSHDRELELIQIVSGTGNVIVGDTIEAFSEGAVLLIDGAALHYICPDPDVPYIRNKIIIDKTQIYDFVRGFMRGGLVFWQASESQQKELDELFCRAVAAFREEKELLAFSEVFRILHICTGFDRKREKEYCGVVADIMNYINERAPENVSLNEISEVLHKNQYYICRVFKRETGMTVHSYMNSLRISEARTLIRDTGIPVAEIADRTGFNGLSSLTKSFKKAVGMTPTAYRKKFRGISDAEE